jgi:hypothetical protein
LLSFDRFSIFALAADKLIDVIDMSRTNMLPEDAPMKIKSSAALLARDSNDCGSAILKICLPA